MPSARQGLDGRRVRQIRKLKGFASQQAFARIIGVPQSHISDLEQGRIRSTAVFLKVADRLECTTDFLFRRGRFRKTAAAAALRDAACRMAFDVFVDSLESLPDEARRNRWVERCSRVIGHKAAPVTSGAWKNLAEQLDLVMGRGEPAPSLKIVGR